MLLGVPSTPGTDRQRGTHSPGPSTSHPWHGRVLPVRAAHGCWNLPPTPCAAPHRARTPHCCWGAAEGAQQGPPHPVSHDLAAELGLGFYSHHQPASIRGCRLINLEARLIPEAPLATEFSAWWPCDTLAVTRPRCRAPGLLSAGSGTPGGPSSPREGCAVIPAGAGGAGRGD